MTTYSLGTLATSSYGMTVSPETAEMRPKTPSGLIVTQAVQTKDGWLGQVIVDKEIVWESPAVDNGEDAVMVANACVVAVVRALFSALPGD